MATINTVRTLGNIQVRQMNFEKAGDIIQGHTHNFDHVTYVAKGILQVELQDDHGITIKTVIKSAREGNNFVLIKAESCHKITALEDNCIGHCVFSHRDPDGKVSTEYTGWEDAYV